MKKILALFVLALMLRVQIISTNKWGAKSGVVVGYTQMGTNTIAIVRLDDGLEPGRVTAWMLDQLGGTQWVEVSPDAH